MVEVAHHIYEEKYMQQADVEEETVQPSNVGRRRCLGSHPKNLIRCAMIAEHWGEDGGER